MSLGGDAKIIGGSPAVFKAKRGGAIPAPKLLDLYPGAAAAYSLRKLRNAYAGAAVRIRRSGDNAEYDFGFTGAGDFDTASAEAFCVAGGGTKNGYISKWYDQSGGAINYQQTNGSKQNQIISNGVVLTDGTNTKPVIKMEANKGLVTDSNIQVFPSKIGTILSVFKNTASFGTICATYQAPSGVDWQLDSSTATIGYKWYSSGGGSTKIAANLDVTTFQTQSQIRTSGTVMGIYTNGVKLQDLTIGNDQQSANKVCLGSFQIGSVPSGDWLVGSFAEQIFWDADQSSNIITIQGNQNSYYGIY